MCVEENFCFEITIFLDFAGVFAKSKMPLKTMCCQLTGNTYINSVTYILVWKRTLELSA